MKKNKLFGLMVSLFIIFAAVQNIYADTRRFVWTYEYQTMPKGMWELETYVTTEVPDMRKSNINSVKPQLELEYGITDRLDVAMYQMWKFKNKRYENDSEYEGFKLRARYRIGEKGRFIVDPLLYFEYIRDDDFSKPNVAEVKLILAKDIGDFNVSYNQIVKRNLQRRGKTDNEFAAGISYALTARLKAGVESKGNYSKEKIALGPTLSYAFKKAFIALGVVFGLNEQTDDLQARVIVGMPF